MPKKRIIDTEEFYFDTELVSLLKDRGLHLYIRLWGLAEDWGGYEPKYEDIALKMGALRLSGKEVQQYITKLLESKKVIEYETSGKRLHWLTNLLKHQPLNNPAPPKLPLPEWINCELYKFKSGKQYAKYTIITDKLPVGYQSATRNSVTNSNSNVTNSNSNVTYSKLSNDEFINKLKENPSYKHINFELEMGKMDAWILARPNRKKTRQFVVNWLNKIEKPLSLQPQARKP